MPVQPISIMSELQWVVFYNDGSRYSNLDGKPWNAPSQNVHTLIQIDSNGKWVLYDKEDHFVWGWRSENEWVSVTESGFWDYLFEYRDAKAILFGRWSDDKTYEDLRLNIHAWYITNSPVATTAR